MIFHSDQGVQYAAWEYTEFLHTADVRVSMSDVGQPTQNALAERFMRTFKEEHLDFADCASFDDAFLPIRQWLDVTYYTQRIHSALDCLTPAEFEEAFYRDRPSLFRHYRSLSRKTSAVHYIVKLFLHTELSGVTVASTARQD